MKITGTVILLLGIILTIFSTVQFFTKEKVVDLGIIEITKQTPHNISWSPIIGIVVMIVGGIVLWQSSKK
jgi:uncharacterized membrane protein YidH (DUF202 family)